MISLKYKSDRLCLCCVQWLPHLREVDPRWWPQSKSQKSLQFFTRPSIAFLTVDNSDSQYIGLLISLQTHQTHSFLRAFVHAGSHTRVHSLTSFSSLLKSPLLGELFLFKIKISPFPSISYPFPWYFFFSTFHGLTYYILYLSWLFSSSECKLHEGRNFYPFVFAAVSLALNTVCGI